uniref:Uncharacterized protein n=1 Tax=Castor canadensis TaxID=51338 RepID=A0A8C0WZ15_CASCN
MSLRFLQNNLRVPCWAQAGLYGTLAEIRDGTVPTLPKGITQFSKVTKFHSMSDLENFLTRM